MSDRDRWDIDVPVTSELGPWPLLVEVARILPPMSWTLIGGMMVQLHALRAGIPHPRATTDVDALIHVETGAMTYRATAGALHRGAVQHRFVRGADVVDVLVADHAVPSVLRARAVPTAVQAPGGTRALRNTVDATVTVNGETIELSLANELGARAQVERVRHSPAGPRPPSRRPANAARGASRPPATSSSAAISPAPRLALECRPPCTRSGLVARAAPGRRPCPPPSATRSPCSSTGSPESPTEPANEAEPAYRDAMPDALDLIPVDKCPDCSTVLFEGRCRGCGYVAPPIPHFERPTDGDELPAIGF